MTEPKLVMHTTTGEICQFARVYYEVFDKKSVLGAFKKLRCMKDDPPRNRWVWLFEQEAKNLRLGKPRNPLLRKILPIVIGSFTFRDEAHLHLDVRSFERATQAIEFFDKYINRQIAKVTSICVVNQLFEATREQSQKLFQPSAADVFFEREDIPQSKGAQMIAIMEGLKEEGDDIENRRKAAIEWVVQQALEPLPKVEEILTNYYEDGIEQLETALRMRQLQLLEQWKGNKEATLFSTIRKIMGGFPNPFSS